MAILKDKAYESAYSTEINNLIDKVTNREAFAYDPANDAAYQALAKEYGRLGDVAQRNTLADVAMNTGGLASSYAVNAASLAKDQYNQALTDKIPALMEAAYSRYQNELTNNMNLIGVLQGLDDSAYGRFSDQRDYDRAVLESNRNYEYQLGRDAIADSQWQQQFDYGKLRDQVADSQWQSQFEYQQGRDQVADSQWQTEYDFMVQQQEYENKFNEQQAQYEKMLTSWNTLGYATKEVAKFFGVKEGTKTSDERYAAASLALDQAKFAYSKQQDALAREAAEAKRADDITQNKVQNMEVLIANSGGSAEQKKAMSTLSQNISNALLKGGDNSYEEIKRMIFGYAGYDENGNRLKNKNGAYVEQKITDKQAEILLDRYL